MNVSGNNDQLILVGQANVMSVNRSFDADICSVQGGCISGIVRFECLSEAPNNSATFLIKRVDWRNSNIKNRLICYVVSSSAESIDRFKLVGLKLSAAVKFLSIGSLFAVVVASQSVAQVSIEEVEAALSALEDSAGIGSSLADTAAISPTTPPPSIATTPPPGGLGDTGFGPDANQVIGGMTFRPILTDRACPTRLADIGEQAQALTARTRTIEVEVLNTTDRFAALEEQNRAQVIDQSLLECPPEFIAEAEDFRSDLSQMELAGLVQEAESFSVCAQVGLQALNERMTALAESNDPNASADRLAVAEVLRRWATFDAEVTEAVRNLVFYDQRRRRLLTATEGFLRRCETFGGY